MINKKFMILAIFLVSILAISTVSAADNATEDIVGVDETTDEVISVNENQTISEDDVLGASPGTFTDLANEIANAGSTLNLNRNYAYTSSDSNYKDGISINKKITINGNGYTINGNNQTRAFQISSSDVVLNNIHFVNCHDGYGGGAVVWRGADGELTDCSFVNCYSAYDSGAVYWYGESGKLSDCSFVNCNVEMSGGAVVWRGVDGELTDCSFVNCYSVYSGAVYWYGDYGAINNCNFEQCTASYEGAVSWSGNNGILSDSTFTNCHASESSNGGAIYWQGTQGTLSNSNFINCTANNGGSSYWTGNEGVLNNCIFMNCHAESQGGGIYFTGTNCTLIDAYFKKNTAGDYPDWYSVEPLNVIETKKSTVLLANNIRTTYGVSKNLTATLKDADENILAGEQITIEFNNIEHELITDSNGQVSLATPNNLAIGDYVATISYKGNDKFKRSLTTANVYVKSKDYVATFTDLANDIANAGNEFNLTTNYTYSDYYDSDYVGGIIINKSIAINGNGFTINGNNQAIIFVITSSDVFLNNINFVNCNNAVYSTDADNGVLSNCSFINCSNDAVTWVGNKGVLDNCNFINCSGKAVYLENSADFVLSKCNFKNCLNGAVNAVFNVDNCVLSNCSFINCPSAISWTVQNSALSNCSFINCPGAVGWQGNKGVLDNCDFMNCPGAVGWQGNKGVLDNCDFMNCSGEVGGAVSWNGNGGTISDSNFMNCHSNSGGAISMRWSDNGMIIGCSFVNCSAEDSGGVYMSGANINIKKSNFINCHADLTGGGATLRGSGSVVDCSFTSCSAGWFGGGICIDNNFILKGNTFKSNSAGEGADYYPTDIVPGKKATTLTATSVTSTYGTKNYVIAALKDANGNPIKGAKIGFANNGVTYVTTDADGKARYYTTELVPGTYNVNVKFYGDDLYKESNTVTSKVVINKAATTLTAKYDAASKNIVATVKDASGNPVVGIKVGFAINGVKYATTDANGQAKYSTADMADGTYKVTVQAYGNEIYKDSNKETVTFTIGSKEMSKIFLRNALYFVTQTKLVQVTLWDGNNQPLAGKTVYIRAYDSVWHGVTDENGDAFVRVGIGFGTHDATVSFDGDDQYFGSEKAGYIRVIKQTPSVMVRGADTMFKASDNNKIVKVHLRDRYDKALPEGSKIVLKLNGKTYVGITDINGVASIKISINTVGTFTAQAMYGGNTAYNPVTRDVKIRIV